MRFRVTIENGKIVEGTYEEILEKMASNPWSKARGEETVEDYMAGVAKRSVNFDGSHIIYHDAKSFIQELCRIGVIIKKEKIEE